MPPKHSAFTSALAVAVMAAAVPALAAEGGVGSAHGPVMMAQAGPGGSDSGAKGHAAKGSGDRNADLRSRHETRMKRFAERRIRLLDTDGDGKISVAEITAEEKRLFAAADVNGDGKLSDEEFRRRGRWFVELGTTSFFDMMDADGDGHLSVQELTGPSERWFKRYDVDTSGTIEADEYVRSRTRGHGDREHRGGDR